MITKQYKNTSFELTEVKDDDRQVSGYASVFDNVDSDNDVIKRGSYTRSIKSWGPEGKNRIKLVSQHDISRPVAKIDAMYEDEKGLFIKATFGTHTDGEDHYRMVKEGLLTEFSVGFVPVKFKENKADGIDIEEIKLYEISLVTVASNEEAIVTDVKAEEVLEVATELIATTDKEEAWELESKLLTLASAFNIKTTQPAVEAPDSEVDEKANELEKLAKAFNINS